jgi:hypothetical protein
MEDRMSIVIVIVLLLAVACAWMLVPPFPRPSELLDISLEAITLRLGQPSADLISESNPGGKAERSISWHKSRGIAVWQFQITGAPEMDAASHPNTAFRCLRTRFEALNFLLPTQFVLRAWVQKSEAPNNSLKSDAAKPRTLG